MHLIILAAGRGSRMLALGANQPKWLLDVGGATLAERHLAAASAAARQSPIAMSSISVVTGHAEEAIAAFLSERDGQRVGVVTNPEYARLNNWYSLLLGLRALPADSGRVVVFNADLFARPDWLARFLIDGASSPSDSLIGVDLARELTDESMKVSIREASGGSSCLEQIGKAGVSSPAGEYVGMFMVRGAALAALQATLESFTGDPAAADAWYEAAIGRTAQSGTDWEVWPTPDSTWVEIDDEADYAAAATLAVGP